MSDKTLEFWFEFASTYSYVAASRIEALAIEADVEILWRPFLLGPIFAAQGWNDSPFNLFPTKGEYMWRDMERLCEKYSLAFKRPTGFPRNGLLAARVAIAADRQPWLGDFVRKVYEANFACDRDISDPDVLSDWIEDADVWLERAATAENKTRLREQTESAQKAGIFGAPSFRVGEELFWGNDRLEDAIAWASQTHS